MLGLGEPAAAAFRLGDVAC